MKPRTKIEHEVWAINAKLKPMTEAQRTYAREHCFKHEAVCKSKHNDTLTCLECGTSWQVDDASALHVTLQDVECPCCGHRLQVNITRRTREMKDVQTFQVLTTRKGFQITRTYQILQITVPGRPAYYEEYEVHQVYQTGDGKQVIMARPRNGLSFYCDSYQLNKPMAIREDRQETNYHFAATAIYPHMSILPILKRNGYCKEMRYYNPTRTFDLLLTNPRYETLAKAKRFDIMEHLTCREIDDYWPQIKMLIRHDYHPVNMGMWKDTIDMADELGLDVHSPKYITPAYLKGMHDLLTKRIMRYRERLAQEAAREEARKREEWTVEYQSKLGELFRMVVVSEDISIVALKNYDEFFEEGKAMHHCVATYWGKDVIIMSVQSNGNRLATVELKMDTLDIVQCRGVCNEKPDRYDEICSIINSHRADFMNAIKRTS